MEKLENANYKEPNKQTFLHKAALILFNIHIFIYLNKSNNHYKMMNTEEIKNHIW